MPLVSSGHLGLCVPEARRPGGGAARRGLRPGRRVRPLSAAAARPAGTLAGHQVSPGAPRRRSPWQRAAARQRRRPREMMTWAGVGDEWCAMF